MVTDHVYLSSMAGVTQERSLTEHGITHILNVATELQNLKYPLDDLKVTRCALRDSVDENILPHLDTLVDIVKVASDGGGRIAVHCIGGISRSATVCIAFLVKHRNMTLKDAYGKVYEARAIINPNSGFWTSLVEFEEQCLGSSSVEMRPYVCGVAPSVYARQMEHRIRCSWIPELMVTWTVFSVIAMVQAYFG